MKSFVPEFLNIKSIHIENWVDRQIDPRALFPVLLRKLVHSTGENLSKVDFPGHDDSQRPGPDGVVISGSATPWIPEGKSYWEFGLNNNPGSKAKSDYEARLKSISLEERLKSNFVFVTPRRWNGKTDWVNEMNNTKQWKNVCAFDSSDLEQWVEQSILTQIWLAEKMDRTLDGYESLDHAWYHWANATEPVLTEKIFSDSISKYKKDVKSWLNNSSDEPYTVVADSRDEALAFLYCLFNEPEMKGYKDLTAVFTTGRKLKELISSTTKFIPIINSNEAEREFLNGYTQHHSLIIKTRNEITDNENISLGLLSRESITEGLSEMGIEKDRIERLISESGKSATILRRRLSKNSAIKKPLWASNIELSKSLVPIIFVGAWDTESKNDWNIVSDITNTDSEDIESNIVKLLSLDDSPVWSSGNYRGIVSKIDALFAVSNIITKPELLNFFDVARRVLSEEDPALELPEEDRWAASIYQKTFSYSRTIRKGICETLVMLSVYGNELFQKRTGVDVEGNINILIQELLEPVTLNKWISHNNNLPYYAEAAPNIFLSLVEKDMKIENSVVFSMIKPVNGGILGTSPPRTGLLWALECLAWKPQNFARSVIILANLSQFEINDNWENKPINSLKAIFRCWMPQTAATVEQRLIILKRLITLYSNVSWKLCMLQINQQDRIGSSSYKPIWRDDAVGAGDIKTYGEIQQFNREVLNILISWENHNEKTLGELLESIHLIPEDDQKKVWKLINEWSETANDYSKATLREQIRIVIFTRNSVHKDIKDNFLENAQEIYQKLKPKDIVIRHKWLYINEWVQPFIDDDEVLDLGETKGNIDNLRYSALENIWSEYGFPGIKVLLSYSESGNVIGRYVAKYIDDFDERITFINSILSTTEDMEDKWKLCLQGFLLELRPDSLTRLLYELSGNLDEANQKRLLKCLPFDSSAWQSLEEFSEVAQAEYWKNVHVHSIHDESSYLGKICDNLLRAKRPTAALYAICHNLKEFNGAYLEGILLSIAMENKELKGNISLENHIISKTLKTLIEKKDINDERIAHLEILYINRLENTGYEFQAIEKVNSKSPTLFMELIKLAFRSENMKESSQGNSEKQQVLGVVAMKVLNKLRTTPGIEEGNIVSSESLRDWVKKARQKSIYLEREDVTDIYIGELLSKSPSNKDGSWPQEGVCIVLEELSSPKIGVGIYTGILNSRGVVFRGPDGDQERQLATKYQNWAEKLYFEYPYVGNVLNDVAKSYAKEAVHFDVEEEIEKRLLE